MSIASSYRNRFGWFDRINLVVLCLLAASMIYPLLYVLTISLSTPAAASRGGLHLFPTEITFDAYRTVLSDPVLLGAFANSVIRTVLGTLLTVTASALAAYPLARRETPFRRQLIFLVLFTMVFSGGLVPNFLLVRSLGLMNTMAALILPVLLTGFNIIIIKNFFQSLPESLVEAAKIDGAGDWLILWRIFIPLSAPVLATVALWTAVFHWNAWFDGMLFITDDSKQVLQVILQRVVIDSSTDFLESGMSDSVAANVTSQTIKAATTMVTVLPIIACYPFLQRFFKKGIMLGGIKE